MTYVLEVTEIATGKRATIDDQHKIVMAGSEELRKFVDHIISSRKLTHHPHYTDATSELMSWFSSSHFAVKRLTPEPPPLPPGVIA